MTTEPDFNLVWEEPPKKPQAYDWDTIADRLRENPGEWMKVFERDRASLAVAIRKGNITALHPEKGFVITTRNNTRGLPRYCTLYVKYDPTEEGQG